MKICLDAGHYGKYNQSPCNRAYYESNMVWKLHLLLKSHLERYGIEVVTTRAAQAADRELYDRGAASRGCSLFVSLHSNAVGNGINNSVDYPVAYCAINGSADIIGSMLAKCVQDVMGTKQPARIEHRKGQHGDYYGVVRGATAVGVPGLILEHSFHTHSRSTEWLMSDDNLEKLAKAEADAIAQYYGILIPNESSSEKPETEKKIGWVQEDGGWRYYLDTQHCVCSDWYQDNDKWYYFDANGKMVESAWQQYKNSWYYLGTGGVMATGLQELDGKWYYLDPEGRMVTEPVTFTPDKDGVLQYRELAK